MKPQSISDPTSAQAATVERIRQSVAQQGSSPKPRPAPKSSSFVLQYKVEPWIHQRQAIERAVSRDHFGLFMDPGTGKTLTAVNILRYKYSVAKRLLPTLILAPPVVLTNWQREFMMHSTLKATDIIVLAGTGKKRLELLQRAIANGPGRGFVAITNYESLLMEPLFKALYEWRPTCIVADESHRVKEPSAKRTKAAIKLADRATDCRLILTGTPVLNSPMDLFSQYRVLDGGATFGTNYFAFRNRYFYDKNAGMPPGKHFPDWRVRDGALQEINKAISVSSMTAKKADCLDLPPLVKKVIHVPLSSKQQKLYNDMKTDFVAYLNDKACVAQLAITKALRLQQIVSGFVSLEDDDGDRSVVELKDNPRADALKELLAELAPHRKVLVWATFRQNYATIRAICEALALRYVELHGEVPAAQRQKSVDAFQTDPACRVLIGHPGSGGIGVNLVAADHAIYYSRSFSLEADIQSEARNHRGGSEIFPSITRIDLVAPATIDEVVLKALAAKQEIGHKLLMQLKEEV